MADIRPFIRSNLLDSLKNYPTVIQDTMIEIITEKLQALYDLTYRFPEIIEPNKSRLDILKAIADQFIFTVRDDADIQEQVDILTNILYVYSRRGSIDTIENMWKYYGGTLPKDVKVIIPSYNLFRYNISRLSGTHRFAKGVVSSITLDTPAPEGVSAGLMAVEVGTTRYRAVTRIIGGSYDISLATVDGLKVGSRLSIGDIYEGTILAISEDRSNMNRSGMYEIRLTNNTYPIPDLREFLIKELVAAGNYIYFTNTQHMDITEYSEFSNRYKYLVQTEDLLEIQLSVLRSNQGLTWSGHNPLSPNPVKYIYDTNAFSPKDIEKMTTQRDYNKSLWSGKASIYLELTKILDIDLEDPFLYLPYDNLGFIVDRIPSFSEVKYNIDIRTDNEISVLRILENFLYCTPSNSSLSISRYLYIDDGWVSADSGPYPGYFVLGKTLLGTEII